MTEQLSISLGIITLRAIHRKKIMLAMNVEFWLKREKKAHSS